MLARPMCPIANGLLSPPEPRTTGRPPGSKDPHELIIRLGRAAEALAEDPRDANFVQAAATFRKLEEVVRSHFGYEETELAEAIGYYLGAI